MLASSMPQQRRPLRPLSSPRSQAKTEKVRTVKMVLTFCIPRLELKPRSNYTNFMSSNCNYRVSAKALIKNQQGQLLFVEEKQDNGYELPGGGIENGETAEQALIREVQEELGVEVTSVAGKPDYLWIINGEVIWVLYEVVIASTDFQKNVHVADAGFYDLEELLKADPVKLGYCCKLNQADLKDYLARSVVG
jgi:8-oxo-dGTP diphosphatase